MKTPKGINQKHDNELFKRIFKPLDDGIDEHGKYIEPTYENQIKEVVKRLLRYIRQCKISNFKKNNRFYLVDELRKSLLEELDETIVNLITSGTGMGKTFLSLVFIKYIVKNCVGIDVVFLCQEYKNGVDQIEKEIIKLDFIEHMIILRSKNEACSQKTIEINKRHNTIEDFIKQGFDIDFYCEKCPDREKCKAISSKNKLDSKIYKSFVGTQSQINAVLPNYFKSHSPTIVLFIDEDMESALERTEEIDKNTLTNNINYLNYEIKREHKKEKSNIKYIEYLNSLKETILILKEGINDDDNNIDYDQLDWLFSDFGYFGKKYRPGKNSFLKKLKDNLQFNVKEDRYRIFNQIYNLITDLIQNYEIENDEKYYPNFEPEKWIKTAIKKGIDYKNKGEFLIDIDFINKINTMKFNENEYILKIIHNDATADKGILQAFYGENQKIVQHGESGLDYEKIRFLQLQIPKRKRNNDDGLPAQYGKSSWRYGTLTEGTLHTLLGYFKSVVDYYVYYLKEEMLTASRNIYSREFRETSMKGAGKSLMNIIKSFEKGSELDNPIKWDEFPLTGTNIYKYINIVNILMKPELSKKGYIRKSILYHTTPEYYRKYYIEKNIKQAYGRIMRGEDIKTVIIFPGYELFTKEFIERNKIDITFFKSGKSFEKYFRNLKYQDIIVKYLKENNDIGILQCMTLLNENDSNTRGILNHLEIERILNHRTEGIGGGYRYFIKE